MAELRELFFETAQELLQSLNDEALRLEKAPDDLESVRSIRRIVHTLKGDSAACGYRALSELAHEFEDALALESAAAQAHLAEVAFTAADVFAALLAAYRHGSKLPSVDPLRRSIHKLTAKPATAKRTAAKAKSRTATKSTRVKKHVTVSPKPAAKVWTEYEQLAIQNAFDQGSQVYHIRAEIDPHCGMPIAGRQLVQAAVISLGELIAVRPEAGASAAGRLVEFLVASNKSLEQIAAKCKIPTVVSRIKVDALKGTRNSDKAISPETVVVADAPPQSEVVEPPDSSVGESDSDLDLRLPTPAPVAAENILRVDAERIDSVLNLVGELIIGKSMLQQALNELAAQHPKDALRGRFGDAMAFQARVLNDLQRSVMKIRMVPVDQLFRRFPRTVRDVARQCGKDVELAISGNDTDLDKSILDAISEPLTHLVRNAVSHGIETTEERKRVGKPAQGVVTLRAYHQGNQVVIEVSDDGRGIDPNKIKAKAAEQGFVTEDETQRLSETELLDFIFRPGFSTAEEVTEVSGRGVGMDVVRSVLQRLKGTVQVDTRPGHGTSFRLKLPLTLAIIKALLFHVEQRLYAIPLNSVVEIARTVESEIHQVDNYEVLQLRNQVLPTIRMGRSPVHGPDSRSQKLFVLVITVGEKKFGLIVDGLEGEEELVIKALDDHAINTDLVSGASILGDGRVVLILNLSAVVERLARTKSENSGPLASGMLLSHSDRLRMSQSAGGQA
jgi:two-component system, chemotaxis family, sensor kinase CheA